MSKKNPVYVQVIISWTQTKQAMLAWLNSAHALPAGITDKQLVDLMNACGKARQRLREKSGG